MTFGPVHPDRMMNPASRNRFNLADLLMPGRRTRREVSRQLAKVSTFDGMEQMRELSTIEVHDDWTFVVDRLFGWAQRVVAVVSLEFCRGIAAHRNGHAFAAACQ